MRITAGEYLEGKGIKIGLGSKASVDHADRALDLDERVHHALLATLTIDGTAHPGVAVVTTHRLLCCTSVANNTTLVTLPYVDTVGIGDITGGLLKAMPVTCCGISVTIGGTKEHLAQLQAAILDAIEDAPNHKPIDFRPGVFIQTAEQHRAVKAIKDAHRGERRLSKREAEKYGPCPECGKLLVLEKGRRIACGACGHIYK